MVEHFNITSLSDLISGIFSGAAVAIGICYCVTGWSHTRHPYVRLIVYGYLDSKTFCNLFVRVTLDISTILFHVFQLISLFQVLSKY